MGVKAAASGLPLSSQLAAHQIAMLNSKIRAFGCRVYALAFCSVRVTEGCSVAPGDDFVLVALERARRTGEFRPDVPVVAMPIEVGLEGVRRVIEPKLTRQEQTLLENAIDL